MNDPCSPLSPELERLQARQLELENQIAELQTRLARSEEARRISESRLRDITDSLPDLVGYVDREQHYRFNSKAYQSWFGRTPDELYGLHLREAVGVKTYEAVRPSVEAALAGKRVSFEWWRPTDAGTQRFVRSEYIPDVWEDGSVRGFYLLATDLTELKRSEESLRESEQRLRVAIEAGRMAIWELHIPTQNVRISRELNQLLGLELDAIPTAAELRARYHPDDLERVQEAGRAALARGDRFTEVEFRFFRPDGEVRWLLVRAEIRADEDGTPAYFVGVVIDVTENRKAEAALRENEQRLRATYEHAFIGIGEVDPGGCFLHVNEQLCSITGYSREELLTRTIADLTHSDDRSTDLMQFHRQMEGNLQTYAVEKRYIHKDGHIVWVEVAASRVDDAAGRPLYGIRAVRDITGQKRAEEHQRLLINELNHRVKNTLATVQSIASQTLRNAPSPEQARSDLEGRLFALSRAHDVLTRENWEGANLGEIIAQAIAPYRSRGESRFHCQGSGVRLSPQMSLALAMALQELVTNAAKYGALSNLTGEIHVTWLIDHSTSPPSLHLRWEERGGPPVGPPTRRGFGSRLIERSLAHDLQGKAIIEFAAAGVICTVDAPVLSAATEETSGNSALFAITEP
jgi:PAS domain S-box-containing protein